MLLPLRTKLLRSLSFVSQLRDQTSRVMAGLIFCGGLITTITIAVEEHNLTSKREAAIVEQNLLQVKSNIERTLNQRLNLLISLAALVDSHAQQNRLSASDLDLDFQALTAALDRQVSGVLSLQLAPDGVVTYLTDIQDNRKAIGFDILVQPERREIALLTIQQRSMNLVGPTQLMQGGEAVIARLPIFIPGAFDPQTYITSGRAQLQDSWLRKIPPDFWGFAIVLIDTKMLYQEAGLNNLPEGYRYALRGRNGTGAEGDVFWGDATVFDRPLHTIEITFPNGKWVLGVDSIEGGNEGNSLIILFIGISLSGAVSYAVYINQAAKEIAEINSQKKGDFLAVMSHELRTPLNGIIGLTDLALHTHHEADRVYYLEKIQASSQLLLRLVNDVLDFSKLEAGKFTIVSAPFCLDDIFSSLRDLLALQAIEKGLELVFHIGADVPQELVGDSLRLSQVLINLVANAIKFTDKGSVTLVVDRLTSSTHDVRLRFDVCDTGIGLTSEQISTLFHAFTQVHDFQTRSHGGTGLGLTICQRLLGLMGGTITINSESGRGSRFRVCLDFQTPDTVASESVTTDDDLPLPSPLSGEFVQCSPMRCLVVDDSLSTRQAIAVMLETFGLEVTVADSGTTAIETLLAAEAEPFDLLLIDDAMPEMSGYETVLRLDADFLISPLIRVLLLPPNCSITPEMDTQYRGIDYQLQKPVDRRQLYDLLQAIDSGRPRSPSHTTHRATVAPHRSSIATSHPSPPTSSTPMHPSQSSPVLPSITAPPQELPEVSYAQVLLIEDNEVNQIVAREMLHRLRCHVEIAHNGYDAIQCVQAHRYDLLLMDVQMPQMDGLEATRRIRQLAATGDQYRWCDTVPIVAMTAHSLQDYENVCKTAGMDAQIAKPITIDVLSATLQRWLPHVSPHHLSPAGILPYDRVNLDPPFETPPVMTYPMRSAQLPEASPLPEHSDLPHSHTPQFPGLSIETGLQRMGNDWEGYGELLQLFTTTYRSFDQDCETLIDQGNYAQAKDILHTLKGAAGNIAADQLMQAAHQLEQELSAESLIPDRIVAQLLVTIREFYQVLNSIDAITDYINSTRQFDD